MLCHNVFPPINDEIFDDAINVAIGNSNMLATAMNYDTTL